MAASLYEKYGGFGPISRVVMAFYARVLDSDLIGAYFEDIDIARLVDHQTKFIASLMGGPASYTDDQLRRLHAHLTITDAAFDEMTHLLEETLLRHSFSPVDAKRVTAEIERRRPCIVNSR